jgi:hypothetical protein
MTGAGHHRTHRDHRVVAGSWLRDSGHTRIENLISPDSTAVESKGHDMFHDPNRRNPKEETPLVNSPLVKRRVCELTIGKQATMMATSVTPKF